MAEERAGQVHEQQGGVVPGDAPPRRWDQLMDAADAAYRRGCEHLRAAEVEAAVACFHDAGNAYRAIADVAGIADVDDAMGVLLCHLDRPADALVLHERAATTYSQLDAAADVAIAAGNAMWAALDLGDPTAALSWADTAIAAAVDTDDDTAEWLATVARTLPLLALGLDDEADEAADEPLPADLDDDHLAFVNRTWARIHASRDEHDEAVQHWSRALELYAGAGNIIEVRCTLRDVPAALRSRLPEQER